MNFYGKPDYEDLVPGPRTKVQRPKNRPKMGYLEYLEMTADEFKKFKHMEPIKMEEINNVDWDLLTIQLQG